MEEFKKEDITVLWDATKCVHAGYCVKLLPNVYRPGETPWVHTDCASKEDIINQVSQCPSGALTIKQQ
ncbi:(4Fe-4S)-binding protein [Pontimicrobium sp. SW4]|uniref:(4Fe-4S)-binding protein n=1 Tax=Pontimicrobium sp. SW4 TaxID=3153519 RepID=A0AAU7BRU4_9FLAO